MGITPTQSSADQISDDVARRGLIVTRTLLLLIFQFVLMSLGFIAAWAGVIIRDSRGLRDEIPFQQQARALTLIPLYLLFIGIAGGIQKSIRNRHPRLFAEHHLLRALELISTLRPGTAHGRRPVDVDQIRQNLVAELGAAATHLRRHIGRRRPRLDPTARDNARQRAAEVARTISGYQEAALYGSMEEVFSLATEIWRNLVALAEQRLGDLPRPAEASRSSEISEHRHAMSPESADSTATNPDDRPFQPRSGKFLPEDVEALRREMSHIYTTAASAAPVLNGAEYPPERRPNIDYHRPETAWREIFKDLENGAVENPYGRLLACALEAHPANQILRDLASRYGLPVPRTRVRSRTGHLTPRFRWRRL
jgi:hypothetical protein